MRLQFNHEDGFCRNIAKRLKVLHGHIYNDAPQNPPFARDVLEILKDILQDWLMPNRYAIQEVKLTEEEKSYIEK